MKTWVWKNRDIVVWILIAVALSVGIAVEDRLNTSQTMEITDPALIEILDRYQAVEK